MRKTVLILAAVVALLSTGLAEAAPRERSVSITRGRVAPHTLRLESGATLTWRNLDSVPRVVDVVEHVARDGAKSDPAVTSPTLGSYVRGATAAAFSHTFVEAGTYRYKLAGTSAQYTIVVDQPKVAPPAKTPAATATPRPAKPTATPSPTPKTLSPAAIATVGPWPPAELPTNWQRGYCGGWEARRLSASSVRLTGECVFPTGFFTVKMTPRQLNGPSLLIDKLMTRLTGPAPTFIETVPVSLVVTAGPERRDIIVMPDRVRVPIWDVSID